MRWPPSSLLPVILLRPLQHQTSREEILVSETGVVGQVPLHVLAVQRQPRLLCCLFAVSGILSGNYCPSLTSVNRCEELPADGPRRSTPTYQWSSLSWPERSVLSSNLAAANYFSLSTWSTEVLHGVSLPIDKVVNGLLLGEVQTDVVSHVWLYVFVGIPLCVPAPHPTSLSRFRAPSFWQFRWLDNLWLKAILPSHLAGICRDLYKILKYPPFHVKESSEEK